MSVPPERNQRILRVVHNLHWYTVNLLWCPTRIPKAFLPTSKQKKLKLFGLFGLETGGSTHSCDPGTLEELPPSIEILALDSIAVPSVKFNLPHLRRLGLAHGTVLTGNTFNACKAINSLYLLEPPPSCMRAILPSVGSRVTKVRIHKQTLIWQQEYFVALEQLPILELDGFDSMVDPSMLPQHLTRLVWNSMERQKVWDMLKNLCNPDFLPDLEAMPELYWAPYERLNLDHEGDYSNSAYGKLHKRALDTLESRGLPCLSCRSEGLDPVFDARTEKELSPETRGFAGLLAWIDRAGIDREDDTSF